MDSSKNKFALLDDEVSDDLSKLLANVTVKTGSSSSSLRPSSTSLRSPSKPVHSSQHVRAERGRGRGRGRGQGEQNHGSGRCRRNNMERIENGQPNGYQHNYRVANGHHRYNGQSNGHQRDNQGIDGYQWGNNGYMQHNGQADGYWQGQGLGGGRGRGGDQGRRFNEELGFERKVQSVKNDQQLKIQGSEGGSGDSQGNLSESDSNRDGNWIVVAEKRSAWRYRGSRTRGENFSGGDEVSFKGRGEAIKGSESNEVIPNTGEHEVTVDNNSSGAEENASVTTEGSKDAEHKKGRKGKLPQVAAQNNSESEDKAKQEVKENNKMTLEEYQKQLLEKRKALESLKTRERKVTLDKDFEMMQLVGKKKQVDIFIKNSEKDKIKKKDSLDKDEKARKSVSINEFLKPAKGEYYQRRDGRYYLRKEGSGYRIQNLTRWADEVREDVSAPAPAPAPAPEDSRQFPALG